MNRRDIRPKGEWILHNNECGDTRQYSSYECSNCHSWFREDSNFCPNCGADMTESEDK